MTDGSNPGTATTVAGFTSLDFVASPFFDAATMVETDSFGVHLTNTARKSADTIDITATLGYSTDGANWISKHWTHMYEVPIQIYVSV